MNKNNLKIAVDFDGTLARTADFICELINFRTGSNHTYKEINSWDYWENIGKGKDFWDAYDFMDKNGRLLIKPYDNYVFESLRKINSLKWNEFHIVTANNEEAANQIYNWVDTYGFFNEDDYLRFNVHCIGRKTSAEKLELDYDLYIDDNPGLALEAKNYPNKTILLANAPWNKHVPNTNNVFRFQSWKEIPELVKIITSPKCHTC